jgi:glycosyltransferase involved in cell wall biosynthesis
MPERLRIAQLVYSLDIEAGGGVTRTALEMVKKLDPARFEVSLVSLGYPGPHPETDLVADLQAQGIRVFEPPGWDVRHPYRSFYRSLLALRGELIYRPVDLLHSHSEFSDISACALKLMGSPAILLRTVHYPYAEEWKDRPARRLFLTNFLYPLLFAGEVAVNQVNAARLNRRLAARLLKRRARCIHSAIQLERFAQPRRPGVNIRRDLGIPPDACVVGTVGRLAQQKGYSVLLAAAAAALARRSALFFLVVGDGPQAQALRQQADQLGISSRVLFTGGRADVEDLLAAMDLFVSSSLWEGLPAVILEAMASGVPVIATRIPGTLEVVTHGVDGWLVPPGEAQPLAEAILLLSSDPSLQAALVDQGRLRVQDFSLDRLVSSYESLYQELGSRHRRSR